MDLAECIEQFVAARGLNAPGVRVLVGLSGGADSVVLAHALHRQGVDLVAAHVNYGLRGEAADADEAFVRAFCDERVLPLHIHCVDLKARVEKQSTSIQAAARAVRYCFFARQARRADCTHVAVGHHRDDQAETLLLNLLRGSGPEGLAAMPPVRPMAGNPDLLLVRPLLEVRRADIEAYAHAAGLAWRTDATNRSSAYRRGVLRNDILPQLETHFGPGVATNLARTAALLRAYVEDTLRPELDARFAACARAEDDSGQLDLQALCAMPAVWRRRLILEALACWLPGAPQSAAVAEEVAALIEAQVGRRVELGAGAVWRTRDGLHFLPAGASHEVPAPQRLVLESAVEWAGGTLWAEALAERPAQLDPGTSNVTYADADRLTFPLTVRRWQAGDRFRPLGMTGTKKVSDLLTDIRVPPQRRRQVAVVCSEGDIVWVAGVRLADAVRVGPETERVVQFRYEVSG